MLLEEWKNTMSDFIKLSQKKTWMKNEEEKYLAVSSIN